MTPLHIPLSHLPAPVPPGCPVHHPKFGAGLLLGWDDGEPVACFTRVGIVLNSAQSLRDVPGLCVDLTPPPLDANGNPTRIDALPVLVGMLARAMGHPEGQRTLRPSLVCGEWVLRTWTDGGVYHFTRFTLASIDSTDRNAPRLALAALLAARGVAGPDGES